MSDRELDRRRIVRLLWLYFGLLVAEGALRKWIVPGFSDALLIVRDPVAFGIVYLGIRGGFLPDTPLVRVLGWLLAAFTCMGGLQMLLIDLPPLILGYGLRTYFLHVPLLFIMALVLTPLDIRRFAYATFVLAIPIAALMAQQFNAGPDDWINRGAGEGRLQIMTSLGRIRPAGPFSFISGPILFFTMSFALLAAAHLRRMHLPVVVLAGAWGSLVVATAVSGSRALLAGLVPVGLAVAVAVLVRPSFIGGFARGAVVAGAIVSAIWGSTIVQDGLEVLSTRIEDAGGSEEVHRRSSDMYLFTSVAWSDAPALGLGIGLGTNAANALLGTAVFRFGESEWTRVLFEAGPILGLAYLCWRAWLALYLLRSAWHVLAQGEVLPLLLAAAALANVVFGPWGQPSTQGFAVWSVGLAFAACRVPRASYRARQCRTRPVPSEGPRSPAPTGADWSAPRLDRVGHA